MVYTLLGLLMGCDGLLSTNLKIVMAWEFPMPG